MQEAASGKCFTVLSSQALECTLKRREYITLVFNLSSVFRKAMDLTFHEPEDPFGRNEENWSGEVSSTTIHSQVFLTPYLKGDNDFFLFLLENVAETFLGCV